jgi:hypothetical protein
MMRLRAWLIEWVQTIGLPLEHIDFSRSNAKCSFEAYSSSN